MCTTFQMDSYVFLGELFCFENMLLADDLELRLLNFEKN